MRRWVRVLGWFCRENYWYWVLLVAFAGIFQMTFSLYHLEKEAIWYSVLLCVVCFTIIEIIRFVQYCRRYQERKNIGNNITLCYRELPKAHQLAEKDCQEMLVDFGKYHDNITTHFRKQKQDYIDYYSTWVHQIKTPISAMKMLLDERDTAENRLLSSELFRVEQYVEMALTYVRLDSETSDFVFREYQLDDIIRQAIRKFAPQFVQRKLILCYEPAECTVLTDEKWLLFIIEQVLSNAVKYTPKGSITISVTPEKRLTILDTGIGIASEDLPRIFEKGYTGYNGRLDKKATGLGLYLCQQVANKLSVQLEVTSIVGVGTTVSIDLRINPLDVE